MKRQWRQTRLWAVLVLFVSNAGCALMIGSYSEYTPLNSVAGKCNHPPVSRDAITITTTSPARPHIEAGLIEISAVGTGSGATTKALDLIRERASAEGCHAARLGGMSVKPGDDYGEPTGTPLDILSLMATDPKDRKLVNATCIVYLDPDCREEPPALARSSTRPPPARAAVTSTAPSAAAARRPIVNHDAAWAPR